MDIFSFTPPWPPLPPGRKVYPAMVGCLKGECHGMNIILSVPKIKSVLFVLALIVFTIFWCLFVETIEN
jgi:hypothetical protein